MILVIFLKDSGTIACISIVLILIFIIVFIIAYYKVYLRFKRLKSELAHVHYRADPGATNPGKTLNFLIHCFYFMWIFFTKLGIL